MTAKWINTLNESDSRLHKEAVLKMALDEANADSFSAQTFLGLTKAACNPYITFGVKQIPETVGITGAENPWIEFNELLVTLSQRELTGNAARDAINDISQRFDSEEWNTFCRAVLRKDLRAGISSTTVNKIVKKTQYEIPVFGCQLASNSEGRPEMKGIKRLEPKLDGVRVLMVVTNDSNVNVISYSRNGKVFENFTHIEQQIASNYASLVQNKYSDLLKDGFVLDGEVIGNSFQELMRQARRKDNVKNDDSVFNVFDIIPINDFREGVFKKPLKYRIEMLKALSKVIDTMDNVALLPHIMVDLDTSEGKKALDEYAMEQVNLGFEGIMVKDVEAIYECDRNTNWMKWKPVYDYDLKVVGVEEGTGKNKGRMGALVCEGVDDGKHIMVNVGSGYTDGERQQYWDDQNSVIGQTAVVLADAITKNQNGTYSLRFPRFKTFREDK